MSFPDDEMPSRPQMIGGGGSRPLDVTVTILSLSGLHAKECGKKKKKAPSLKPKKFSGMPWWQQKAAPDDATEATSESAAVDGPLTTVVASYERPLPGHVGMMTHVPSHPLPPLSAGKKGTSAFEDVVRWPEQGEGTHSRISTFTFRRSFPVETTAANGPRFEAQVCPIQVCVSRNGKMFRLGSAHLIVSGNEDGASSVDVPVVDFEAAFKAPRASKGGKVELKRLRGETLQCGLAERAALQVLVSVSDPSAFVPTRSAIAGTSKADASNDGNSIATEYGPDQEGAVPKKSSTVGIAHTKELSPTSLMPRKDKVSQRKNAPSDIAGRDHRDDDRSHGDSVSTDASSRASTNDEGGRHLDRMTYSYDSEDSLYSGSASDLLKLINDVARKNFTRDDRGVTMSSSVQSYQRKRGERGERRDEDDSTVTTSTSASVGHSSFPSLYRSDNNKPTSAMGRWGRRLVCCAGPGLGLRADSGRAEDWLMESIDEEDSYNDNNGYSLEGREHSGGSYSLRRTDRTESDERSGYDF